MPLPLTERAQLFRQNEKQFQEKKTNTVTEQRLLFPQGQRQQATVCLQNFTA
jgi:hypothetical protein